MKSKKGRKYKFCPFQKCIKAVQKLSQHILDVHPHVSKVKREQMCKSAEVAANKWARKPIPQPPSQRSIKSYLPSQVVARLSTDDDKFLPGDTADIPLAGPSTAETPTTETQPSTSATESIPLAVPRTKETPTTKTPPSTSATETQKSSFPLSHPFLVGLKQYLLSRHGKERSDREALQICVEVSKFLYFFNSESLEEQALLDPLTLDRYLQNIEGGVQAATQNSKLNRIKQAVIFLSLSLDSDALPRVERALCLIRNWASVLGKAARQANRERLEELSEQPVSFGDIDELVRCQALHQKLHESVDLVKKGKPVGGHDIGNLTVWVAGCLLLTNCNRPGAIANMTVEEYRKAITTTVGRVTTISIAVSKHKTGTTGLARIKAFGLLRQILLEYSQHIHPLHVSSPLLFPNSKGKPLDHLSRSVQQLAAKHGLTVPTATEARHVAATIAAEKCTEHEREAVATHMSHSRATQQLHYVRKKNIEESVKGYQVLTKLRDGSELTHGTRVQFSAEEIESISIYFESYIAAGDKPSIRDCRDFLANHNLAREPKQIRDKVRHLIKQKAKEKEPESKD